MDYWTTGGSNSPATFRMCYMLDNKFCRMQHTRRPSGGHGGPGRRISHLGHPSRGHAPGSSVEQLSTVWLLRGLLLMVLWPRERKRCPIAVLEVELSRCPPLMVLQHRRRQTPPRNRHRRPVCLDNGDGRAPVLIPAPLPVYRRHPAWLFLSSAEK